MRTDLPPEMVTLLCADVEGSTGLRQELDDEAYGFLTISACRIRLEGDAQGRRQA